METPEKDLVKRLRRTAHVYDQHDAAADVIERLIRERDELRNLVASFVNNEIDYMAENDLGNPFAQHNVKWALKLGAVIDVSWRQYDD